MSEKLIKKRINAPELNTLKYQLRSLDDKKRQPELLQRAQQAWMNMADIRAHGARNNRFVYGDQWGDVITVYIDGQKRTMTMREYLSMDGQVPMQTNQVKSQINTIVGVLIKEQNEPVCNAIDRDEQQYGEVLTKGLQANNNKNRINTIHKLCTTDLLIRGIAAAKEVYGYRENDRRREDSWTYYVDPNYLILETTLRDPRWWDMTMIGCWYRMSRKTLQAEYVNHGGNIEEFKRIYGEQSNADGELNGITLGDERDLDAISLWAPQR